MMTTLRKLAAIPAWDLPGRDLSVAYLRLPDTLQG